MKILCILAVLVVMLPLVGSAEIKLSWRNGKPMPVPAALAVAMTRRGLVTMGGTSWQNDVKLWLKDVRLYDPAHDSWSSLPALPEPLGVAASATVRDTVYIIGGSDGEATSTRVYRLRPGATAWEKGPELPERRVYASAEAIGTRIYLAVGSDDVKSTRGTTSLWMLDTAEPGRGWQKRAALPGHERTLVGLVAAGGKLYLFGGYSQLADGKPGNLADAWSYDSAHDQWHRLADLPVGNRYPGVVAWNDDTLLLLGGAVTQPGGADTITDSVWAYHVKANTWAEIGKLPSVNAGMVFFRSGGNVIGIGGEPGAKRRSEGVWIGTPSM